MERSADPAPRRRSLLGLALAAPFLVAASRLFPRRRPREFSTRTAPGDRYRSFALGNRRLYVREDLIRTGWFRDFRFHDGRRGARR